MLEPTITVLGTASDGWRVGALFLGINVLGTGLAVLYFAKRQQARLAQILAVSLIPTLACFVVVGGAARLSVTRAERVAELQNALGVFSVEYAATVHAGRPGQSTTPPIVYGNAQTVTYMADQDWFTLVMRHARDTTLKCTMTGMRNLHTSCGAPWLRGGDAPPPPRAQGRERLSTAR
jgi:hypothetical protein